MARPASNGTSKLRKILEPVMLGQGMGQEAGPSDAPKEVFWTLGYAGFILS